MTTIKFQILSAVDQQDFPLIAGWYMDEWKMHPDKAMKKLRDVTTTGLQFHVLVTVNGIPAATGGVHSHVGLQDKVPRFKEYKHWMALVYAKPEFRKKGYGTSLCNYIQDHAKSQGIEELHLFTDTAEQLYEKLGWQQIESGVIMGERTVTVMKIKL